MCDCRGAGDEAVCQACGYEEYLESKMFANPVHDPGFDYESEMCFHPQSCVTLTDGTLKEAQHLQKGDMVALPFSSPSATTPSLESSPMQIECVIKSNCRKGADFVELQSADKQAAPLLITPSHPVRINNEWSSPCNLGETRRLDCDAVYNFVLTAVPELPSEEGTPSLVQRKPVHSMLIGGIECVTLGHGRHPYFGSQLIIEDLKQMRGWGAGFVELAPGSAKRDAAGLVCGIGRGAAGGSYSAC
jgi:hypothetical protein